LGSYHRQITVQRTAISLNFRALKNYPVAPKTLGEYLRQKRVDLGLSQRKLAEMLDIGVTDTAVEKWEKSQNRPTESHRRRIIEFLGFDPTTPNVTGWI
jgi:ribosome-binding protein aMBF1 (putative translation factor)